MRKTDRPLDKEVQDWYTDSPSYKSTTEYNEDWKMIRDRLEHGVTVRASNYA